MSDELEQAVLGGVVGRDLDETRRLLYMAKYVSRTDKYVLVGTLVNALVHHSGLETSATDAADRLIALRDGIEGPEWADALIDELTARLDVPAAPADAAVNGAGVPETA